jgi:uncharacterized membrane protein (DUF485 family)
MWPSLIKKAKEGGINTIETYVFWNAHEAQRRQVLSISSLIFFFFFFFFKIIINFQLFGFINRNHDN